MKRVFLIAVAVFVITGCSQKPDCGSSDAKKLVLQLAPSSVSGDKLVNFIGDNSTQFKTYAQWRNNFNPFWDKEVRELESATGESWLMIGQRFKKEKQEAFVTEWNTAKMATKWDLTNIVTTDKNETTGAVTCKGRLSASMAGWGDAGLDDVQFKLEKTTKGELYATVW